MEQSMAKVYVGTYAKYNAGNIDGAWLDLEDYADREEFEAAARELHKDESDPELMFQDHEDIPAGMIGESWIDEGLWEWLELDEDDRNMVVAYREGVDEAASIEKIRESFYGTADSREDFAQQYAEETGAVNEDASWPNNYIDWEAAARDLFMDFSGVDYNGRLYVFRD